MKAGRKRSFDKQEILPSLSDGCVNQKFIGTALFYGFNDFYDAPQIFCSNNILGLGIGNVDRNYPLFGIPTLQFCSGA